MPKTITVSDPCDLRPAVDGLMSRIENVSKSLREGQPLVILMGEQHNLPSHIMLQHLLLDRLRKSAASRVAVGFEEPRNLPDVILNKGFDINTRHVPPGALMAADRDGYKSLSAALALWNPDDAPLSVLSLFDFCRQNFSSRFNDAAKVCGPSGFINRIDKKDPATSAVMTRLGMDCGGILSPISPPGLKLRNIMMAESAMTHIRESGARLYIQRCGRTHIFGDIKGGHHYQDSLTALFADAGAAVLPVFVDIPKFDAEQTLQTAFKAPETRHTMIVKNLCDKEFMDTKSDGEAGFINELARHSGADIKIFNDRAERESLQYSVYRSAQEWVKSAQQMTENPQPAQPALMPVG